MNNKNEKFLEENPLVRKSLQSQMQYKFLIECGENTNELIEKSFLEDSIDGVFLNKAYWQIWLWVLGAYEFSRTLCDFENIYGENFKKEINDLKQELAYLRMPFAKQEYRGKKNTNASKSTYISNFNNEDLDYEFDVNGKIITFKGLYYNFKKVFEKI